MFDSLKQYIGSLNPIVLAKTLQVAQIFTFILVFITLIFTIYNVSRTQRKNRENDIEKFKRDLNLKAADELIENILNLNDVCQNIFNFDTRWNLFLKSHISFQTLHENIYSLISGLQTNSLNLIIQNRKREIIYVDLQAEILSIHEKVAKLLLNIMEYFARIIDKKEEGKTDQDIQKSIILLKNDSINILDKLDMVLKRVQHDFFGEIYNRK